METLKQDLDSNNRQLGSGWLSGVLALFLAVAGLSAVLCVCFPQILTVADSREYYNMSVIRVAIHVVLLAAFFLALLNVVLRDQKVMGFAALLLVMIASLMGGSQASMKADFSSDIYLGLDFFILNLVFLGAVFIPIEQLFQKNKQAILRYEWREDLLYFFISTLFVQGLTFASLAPSLTVLAATEWAAGVRSLIASQPILLQFLEIMFLTDLVQYWVHRVFHRHARLWKFHAVHHSARAMDWLAGSRMHLLEVIVLRSLTTLPMYVLGYAESALYAYILFVYILSVFIHSNLSIPFGFLQYIIATPRFHHWHHGVEKEAIDVNFAIHFPVIDMVFGTFHMPEDRWPTGYGIDGHPVPKGFWQQFLYPFSADEQSKNEKPE
ncbi:MAG: sterol desaturase family protein [Planctomycetota bacterium]